MEKLYASVGSMTEHPNCRAIEKFIEPLKVSLPIAQTERIDDEPVNNGFTSAYFNSKIGVGFTVVAWDNPHNSYKPGFLKILVECVGSIDDVERFFKYLKPAIEPE